MSEHQWVIPPDLGWEVEGVLYRSHPEANAAVARIKKATGKRPELRGPRALPDGWVMVGEGAFSGWPAPRRLLDAQGHLPPGITPHVETGLDPLPLRRAPPASAPQLVAAELAPAAPVFTPPPQAPHPDAERITAALDLRRREVEATERRAAAAERSAEAAERIATVQEASARALQDLSVSLLTWMETKGAPWLAADVTGSSPGAPVTHDQAPEVSHDQAPEESGS